MAPIIPQTASSLAGNMLAEGDALLNLNQAIISFVTALLGAGTAWLVKRKVPPDTSKPAQQQDVTLPSPQEAAESSPTVSVDRYNEVVRRHNELFQKANGLLHERNSFAKLAKDLRLRAERLRLNSRALRLAIYFAITSLLLAVFLPAPPPATAAAAPLTAPALHQLIALTLAAVILPMWLTRDLKKNSPLRPHDIAFTVALLGLGTCGVISMAVSLPYNWARLANAPSPIIGLHLGFFLLILRICIFPVVGYFAALLSLNWQR